MREINHDVLILGTGLAGLRATVEISIKTHGKTDIGIISKVQVMRSHSVCAEGGTAAVMRTEEGDSLELHSWDTVKGSDFLADQDVVDRFVQTSPDEIRLLEHRGVLWSRRDDGRIMQRPFGGHSCPRACMAADKTGFFEMQALWAVNPHIVRADEAEIDDPAGEFYQSPEELEAYLQFTYCIKCGCCMGACPTLATDVRYQGPMPLTAAQRYNTDSRDEGSRLRRDSTEAGAGAFRCHYAGECSRVCPKGVDPGKAIQLLKRQLVLDYLHLSSHKKRCKTLTGPGNGKPLPNTPDAPKRTIGLETVSISK
jgi:heterodisulfide reductase subunit C